MADLRPIGRILGVIGGLIMIIIGIIMVINNLLEAGQELLNLDLLGFSVVGGAVGTEGWIITAAVMIVCGLIAIIGYQKLSTKKKEPLLLWGIIYVVIGFVGGTVGAVLILIGGIILIIDYFV